MHIQNRSNHKDSNKPVKFCLSVVCIMIIFGFYHFYWAKVSFAGTTYSLKPISLFSNPNAMSDMIKIDGALLFVRLFLCISTISFVTLIISTIFYLRNPAMFLSYIGFGASFFAYLLFLVFVTYVNLTTFQANYIVKLTIFPIVGFIISTGAFFLLVDRPSNLVGKNTKPLICPECGSTDSLYDYGDIWRCFICRHSISKREWLDQNVNK